MPNDEKKEIRCQTCKSLLFKNKNASGEVEIKCRRCNKIVDVLLTPKPVANIDVK